MHRRQPGLLNIGGADNRDIHFRVIQHARQLRPFQLHNPQVFGVGGNIQRRRQQTGVWLQGYELLFLQQQQRASQVGRIVWNGDGRAVLQVRHGFDFAGVARHRENKSIRHGDQLVVMRLIILFKERAMLENVGIQFPLVGGVVGQQRTAEAHQLHIQAIFLLSHFFGDFRHVLFSAIDDADFNVFGIAATLIASCQQQTCENQSTQSTFHKTVPFDKWCSDYIDNEAVK